MQHALESAQEQVDLEYIHTIDIDSARDLGGD